MASRVLKRHDTADPITGTATSDDEPSGVVHALSSPFQSVLGVVKDVINTIIGFVNHIPGVDIPLIGGGERLHA